ncbi:MAG: PilZ domain-containing protein [Vicinamibacteria bacterium]
MKNHTYQPKVMRRVLICSQRDLRPELATTCIGREGIEVYRVEKFADAKLVASSLGVQVLLVDRDLPDAATFIGKLRHDPATRGRSVGVLTRGAAQPLDKQLLTAGANALFRMPPDDGWDERFAKLLEVPVRQQARMVARVQIDTEVERMAAILNLSPGGMLLATEHAFQLGDEFAFRFSMPDKKVVSGRGRVAREARPTGYGVEFLDLDGDGAAMVLQFLRSARMEEATGG